MKWKIKNPNGDVNYYKPTDVQLSMKNCQLKNNKSSAKKIFEGGQKVVCAWILCEDINIVFENFSKSDINGSKLNYNPRKQPNWVLNDENVDNMFFNHIESVDYGLYVI